MKTIAIFQKGRTTNTNWVHNISIFAILLTLGSLLKVLHDWTGYFSLISPTNSSVWEHSKLLIYPFLLVKGFEFIFLNGDRKKHFVSTVRATLAMQILTIVLLFTYTGIIGTNYLWADILVTAIAIIVGMYVFQKSMKSTYTVSNLSLVLHIFLIILQIILICVFTFYTPYIPLFIAS